MNQHTLKLDQRLNYVYLFNPNGIQGIVLPFRKWLGLILCIVQYHIVLRKRSG